MFGIAFNLLLADRRRRRTRVADPLADPAAPEAGLDDALWVRQAIDRLDERDREIVMLREFDELSYADIAAVLGVPINTVRSRLFRAREELRRQLVPSSEGCGPG